MPKGFEIEGHALHLLKALEGIKQGAYLWFQLNKGAWTKLGFKSWMNEPNLYHHVELNIRVGIFADDALAGFHIKVQGEYKAIKGEYGKLINIGTTEISPALKFTGVQIERNRARRTTKISQPRYIEQMASEYEKEIESHDCPYDTSVEGRKHFNMLVPAKEGEPQFDRGLYLKICGKIIWPSTMSRPDISMAAASLCSCVHAPTPNHYKYALWVVGYLKATKDMGITYGGSIKIPLGLTEHPPHFIDTSGLYASHDSSFGSKPRPMGGYIIMYLNGAVDWSSSHLKIVPDNTNEAESAVGSRAAKAMLFVRALNYFHGRTTVRLTPMLGDNKALYDQMQQDGASSRTRYYERAVLLLKRAVLLLIFRPFLITTVHMIADVMTKATDRGTFYKMRAQMMNLHDGLRGSIENNLYALAGVTHRTLKNLRRHL